MPHNLQEIISAEQIQHCVKELGQQIDAYYTRSDKELILVGLLRGSVIFLADLCRNIQKPHELDFMTVSSYGSGTVSRGEVQILQALNSSLQGKDVLIVEDIIDTGHTLNAVLQLLQRQQPNSIEVCTLISKPSRREVDIAVRFIGMEIPDKFIVGYGLDYAQKYRHLPFIAEMQ